MKYKLRNSFFIIILICLISQYVSAAGEPYMMVLFDTSGSMLFTLDGTLTGGDGSSSPTPWGITCCPGANIDGDSERDGVDSRMYIAKDVLRDVVSGVGELIFGLARYWQEEHPGWTACNYNNACNYIGNGDGNCGNPWGVCSGAGSLDGSIDRISYIGTTCTNSSQNSGNVLIGFDPDDSYRNDLLEFIDNYEESTSAGGFVNPELRGIGATPLAGSINTIATYFQTNVIPTVESCRKLFTIVLTDGGQSAQCSGNPVTATTSLHNLGVDVYVIGFVIDDSGAQDTLDDMAAAGGTGSAHFASNREELAAAFAEIIEDAIQFEKCNGQDDDCDMMIDENLTRQCAGCDITGTQQCEWYAGCVDDECWGECSVPQPGEEICDGIDNDCDDAIDEELEQDCSNECGEGQETCVNGVWTGCTAPQGSMEVCDGIDNDCDNNIDEELSGGACGVNVGICHEGTWECVEGQWQCSGGSPQTEICDGQDNDCDNGIDEEIVIDCSNDCGAGIQECAWYEGCSGDECWTECTALLPETEVCDGKDNDCDDDVDEEIEPRLCVPTTECGDAYQYCENGQWSPCRVPVPGGEVCDGIDNDCDGCIDSTYDPELGCINNVCNQECVPVDEICNGEDDDCDNYIDEGIGMGEECGISNVEPCKYGNEQCIDGSWECVGSVDPQIEICDGIDNDCDNTPDDLAECPEGSICIEGQCAMPCDPAEEFPCPTGKICVDVPEQGYYCVGDPCENVQCETGYRCVGGECIDKCTGVNCGEGTRCKNGSCVEDTCYQFPCEDGEICYQEDCIPDPCLNVECEEEEYCSWGECKPVCGINCEEGYKCIDGECEEDLCYGKNCSHGTCNEATGECSDKCEEIFCRTGMTCNLSTGECEDLPCVGVKCPEGSECRDGVCYEQDIEPVREEILTTGGGGFSCSVAYNKNQSNRFSYIFIVFGIVAFIAFIKSSLKGGQK